VVKKLRAPPLTTHALRLESNSDLTIKPFSALLRDAVRLLEVERPLTFGQAMKVIATNLATGLLLTALTLAAGLRAASG